MRGGLNHVDKRALRTQRFLTADGETPSRQNGATAHCGIRSGGSGTLFLRGENPPFRAGRTSPRFLEFLERLRILDAAHIAQILARVRGLDGSADDLARLGLGELVDEQDLARPERLP